MGRKNVGEHGPAMRKTFQKWLLLFVTAAFIITFCLSFYVQTKQARFNAIEMIRLKIADAKRQLLIAGENLESIRIMTRTEALAKARSFAALIAANPSLLQDRNSCEHLARILNVDQVHVSDANGILIASNDDVIGYDMNAAEQSRAFMPALKDKYFELVQEPRPRGIDGKLFQYAGVARQDKPGIVQIGFYPERLQQAMKIADIRNLAPGFRIGNNGLLVISRDDRIVSCEDNSFIDKPVFEFGISVSDLNSGRVFDVEIAGIHYLGISEKYQDYTLTGLLPDDEMYLSRNAMTLFLIFCNLVIFGVVFILVTVLVQKVVISGIQKVNRSLAQITAGELDEKVDVRTNVEFSSLSEGINTTVNALKQAIAEAAARLDAELEFARAIQLSALPRLFPPFPDRRDFEIYASMDAAREVGGDFYDFFMVGDNRIVMLVADVSGKGIPAAMFMMTAKTMLKNLASAGHSPAEVLTLANRYLCQNNEANMFVTVFLAQLQLDTGKLVAASAGHNPPLLARDEMPYEFMKCKPELVLAAMADVVYTGREIQFAPGDRILLYTDGVTEALNDAGEFYGESRLRNFLNGDRVRELDVTALLTAVKQELQSFANGAAQADDITMLALEYKGGSARNSCKELNIAAKIENLGPVMDFINREIKGANCSPREEMQINLAVEEIFTNIASYAYHPEVGEATVRCALTQDPLEITIQFSDAGTPYNPLDREDPDTTLPADEREIGGLGILMAKKSMDQIHYEYRNHRNILTLKKNINQDGKNTGN